MPALDKRTAVSSLNALRRKVTIETLTHLQPILLLPMVVGVSQSVNSSVSRSRALARTLFLGGQQRLHNLLASAPRLHLPVEQVLVLCYAGGTEYTPEKAAVQALLELCIALILQWLMAYACRRRTPVTLCKRQRVMSPYLLSFASENPPRTRSCPCVSLA
jgi:hypothetical protein